MKVQKISSHHHEIKTTKATPQKIKNLSDFKAEVQQIKAEGAKHNYSKDYTAGKLHDLAKAHPNLAKETGLPQEQYLIKQQLVGKAEPQASMAANKDKKIDKGDHLTVKSLDASVRTGKNQFMLVTVLKGDSVKVLARNKGGDMLKVSEEGTTGWIQRKTLGVSKDQIMGLDVSKKNYARELTGDKKGKEITFLGGDKPRAIDLERKKAIKQDFNVYLGINDKSPVQDALGKVVKIPAGTLIAKRIETGDSGSKMLVMLPDNQPVKFTDKNGISHTIHHIYIDANPRLWNDPTMFDQSKVDKLNVTKDHPIRHVTTT